VRATNPRGADGANLARRLADLRRDTWPDLTITQRQLGEAIGGDRPLSAPTISSWESETNPRLPDADQLADYARFFASRRSADEGLLPDVALTDAEVELRRELEAELVALQTVATATADPLGEIWQLGDARPITIVCSDVAEDIRKAIPRADPNDPDYVELYSFFELDALVEMFGHIRAANPASEVTFRAASTLRPDDFTTHLVVLGGVERNEVARELHARLKMPVRQRSDKMAFEPTAPDDQRLFGPERSDDGILVEDVAHFHRDANPFNVRRTVTLCSAVFNRGVLGAVRALTDARFRNRNESYVRANFDSRRPFSILMRVPIVAGQTMTPDWTAPETVLHSWPPPK
jgi:hypothetical protein